MKTTEYFKALDNRGRMVHGGLVFDREGKPFIGTVHLLTQVNPKTVCRNTGITDSNGKDIYEHDFVCVGYGEKAYVTEVTYEDGCWCTQDGTCSLHEEFCGGDDVRVVGTNITDRLENFYENIHGNDYVKEEYL